MAPGETTHAEITYKGFPGGRYARRLVNHTRLRFPHNRGVDEMRGAKIEVDWERHAPPKDGRLNKFRLFLQEKGIRDSTVEASAHLRE